MPFAWRHSTSSLPRDALPLRTWGPVERGDSCFLGDVAPCFGGLPERRDLDTPWAVEYCHRQAHSGRAERSEAPLRRRGRWLGRNKMLTRQDLRRESITPNRIDFHGCSVCWKAQSRYESDSFDQPNL